MRSLHRQELTDVNRRIWLAYRSHLVLNRRSPETISSYFSAIYNLDTFFGADLLTLTRLDIKNYLTARMETLSPKSVQTYFLALRTFYKWLVAEEVVTRSCFEGLAIPSVPDVPMEVLSEADIKVLLATCSSRSFVDRRDEAMMRIMLEPGGPRRMEILGIKLADLDEANEVIKIHGKGSKVRFMTYGAKTNQALFRYMLLRAKHKYAELDCLWIGKYGELGKKSLGQMLERRCARAGIARIKPHQLRHSAADRAMAAGISDLDMMTLFGWSTPAMLSVYARGNRTSRAINSARMKAIGDRL